MSMFAKCDRNGNNERDTGSDISAAAGGSDCASDVRSELSSSDFDFLRHEEDTERRGDVCVGHLKRDDLVILTATLFNQMRG